LNEALPGTYVLGESRTLAASIRQLEKLEEQIDSDSIPLRSASGRMVASAVINGQHTYDMVVDGGASLVILPLEIAGKCGIEVKTSDPNVILTHADGKKIPGKLVTIESLRVGRFAAKDVKCAVLGIEALNAQPLLGKSFLEKFQYEIDAQKCTLTLIEVASTDRVPAP
jgi:aspartyl protease family protein